MGKKVFIAHNKQADGELAATIAGKLQAMSFDVFFDETSLPPGEGYDLRIKQAIGASDIFVFLISHASLAPGYALTELDLAKQRFRYPNGRVLPVIVEQVESGRVDPYLQPLMFQTRKGDLAADVALRVKVMVERARKRLQRLVLGAIGFAALASAAVLIAAAVTHEKKLETGRSSLGVESVERHREGKPGEGDAFVVNLVARSGEHTPITFEELTVQSRLATMSAEVSHEGDKQYWLTVEPGKLKRWPVIVTWKRDNAAMHAGDFTERFDWRVCWVIAKVRDCGDWMPWQPTGNFAPSSVRDVDRSIADRYLVLSPLSAPIDADETGFWIGLAQTKDEPNLLARVDYSGKIAAKIVLPGEPLAMTRSLDGKLAFVAIKSPLQILRIDLQTKTVRGRSIRSEPDRADLPFSMAWDGDRLWILFDDNKAPEAVRVLDGTEWENPTVGVRKLPYDKALVQLGNTLDEMRLYGRGGVVLGLTSGTPHYVYRFALDRMWEVSGHTVGFIGCLSALTATAQRWLGIACGFDLSELVEQQWPNGSRLPIEANKALDEHVLQRGLDGDYAPIDWDAREIAASGETAVVALSRYDRQTHQLQESAVVYRDAASVWHELFKQPIQITDVSVSKQYALVGALDKGTKRLFIVHLQ